MIKTYTYKIKTTKEFENKFNQWIGACRFLYNCALELKIDMYKRFGKSISNNEIQRQLTEAKNEIVWLKEVNAQTLQSIVEKLDKSFQSFFRRGYGFPKFTNKKRAKSIPFKSIKFKNNRFILPKWGGVNIFKDRLPEGGLKTASLVKKADGYYLHINLEIPFKNLNESQVGLDMGISFFCVTSDGNFIQNPKYTKRYERKLRIENRSLARKKKFSSNWKKQIKKLQLLYLKIGRVRTDFLHKESTKLANNYGVVFMEDLNIGDMVKNKNLSKHILDCGWGKFKNFLSYKSNVFLVNPKYTSQTCSVCGSKDSANRISQSSFVCKSCGAEFNADYNASINIKSKGITLMREREALACA